MTSYIDYQNIKYLEDLCKEVGFEINISKVYNVGNTLSLYPADKLAIYNKDMAVNYGTAEELIHFINGWRKCHEYLQVLGLVNNTKIERRKQIYLNKIRSKKMIEALTQVDK